MNAPNHSSAGTTGDPIVRYLSQLAAAGYDLDPALVNDMLADAEQHLRSAVRDGVTPARAVEDFGEPADVISAYVAADGRASVRRAAFAFPRTVPEMLVAGGAIGSTVKPEPKPLPPPYTMPEPPPAPRSWVTSVPLVGVWLDRYAWGSLALFVLGLAPAILYFVAMVTGVSLALGTFPLIIGVPMLIFVLGLARVLALFHGATIELLTGVRMPRRFAPIPAKGTESLWARLRLWITDGRSWLSAAFLVGNLPVATFLFAVFVTLVTVGASFAALPLIQAVSPKPIFQFGPESVDYLRSLGLSPDPTGRVWMPALGQVMFSLLGLLLLTLTLYLAKGIGWLYAQATKAIQVSRPQLVQR